MATLVSGSVLDVRAIRSDIDAIKAGLRRRGNDTGDVDRAADIDARHRAVLAESENLRAEVKRLSAEVGKLRKSDPAAADDVMNKSRALGEEQRAKDEKASALADELRTVLLGIPNLPADDAPDGK